MIKQLLTISFITAGFFASAQSFSGMYPFTSVSTSTVTGNTGTTDPTPPPVAVGVTFGAFSAVGTATNTSAGGVFAFAGWSLGATNSSDVYASMSQTVDVSKYYDVTLTPQSGYEVTLNSITFNMNRSGTGPRTFVWRSNADGFTTNLPASTTNTNISVQAGDVFLWNLDAFTSGAQQKGFMISLSGANFTSQTSPMNFRMYPYNAEGTGGTFRIDTVTFNGSASLITGLGKVSFDLNSNLNIYPTPSHDGVVYIESKNAIEVSKIEVLDVLGNVVLSNNSKNDVKVRLSLADMPNGNYFVRVYSGSTVATKKIVIVK